MTTRMNMCLIPNDRQGASERLAAISITDWFWPKFVRDWSAACAMSSCRDRTTHVQRTTMNTRPQAHCDRNGIWRAIGWALSILLATAGGVAAQAAVDLQLVLAVDASGSVDQVRFELQKRGYVA